MSPPPLSRRLLAALLPAEMRIEILADLDRLWQERAKREGVASANRWYRGQLLAAFAPSVRAHIRRLRPTTGRGGLDSVRRDMGHAVRQLRRHPGVSVVVVVTLGLGIGAATAVFSAVHGLLLKPLPYGGPDELVMITSREAGSSLDLHVSGPDVLEMEAEIDELVALAGFAEATVGPLTRVDQPQHVVTVPVTWDLFDVLDVEMALGRRFLPEEGGPVPEDAGPRPGAAVVSHDFWVRSLGADPDAVGRVVDVWGNATEIVGVLPEGFRLVVPPALNIPPDADVWTALRTDVSRWPRSGRWLRTLARVAPGVEGERLQDRLDAFAADVRRVHPVHAAEGTTFHATALGPAVAAPVEGPLWLLTGAVLLVLLVACVNVANLLLARGAARSEEMAVRACIGAGRGRLVRQLLTESGVLAVLGGAFGVAVAAGGVEALHHLRPAEMPRLEAIRLDLQVLAFAFSLTTIVTLLAGLLPSLLTVRAAAPGSPRLRGGAAVPRELRSALVVAEVALSVVLVVGAALLLRTFGELQRMPLGFEPEHVLTATATQPIRPAEERRAYEAELVAAARALPGVEAAAVVFPLPMNGVYERIAEWAAEARRHDPAAWEPLYFRTAGPGYFDVMGLRILRGRALEPADEEADLPSVVIDEHLARTAFPGQDPIDRTFRLRGLGYDTLQARVVGVVEHAPQWDHHDTRPTVYLPRRFYRSHEVSLVARVAGSPGPLAPRLADAVRAVDPSFPADVAPMTAYVRDRLARTRLLTFLVQGFAALALGLSAVGLYGVLSYSVRLRRRELGLRMALGAGGGGVVVRVLLEGLRLTAAGLALGAVGAMLLGQVLRSHLFGVSAADPVALGATAAVVFTVSTAAALLPALRAARVDPAVTLRAE